MAKATRDADETDSPWKEALDHFLPYFLAFFFPRVYEDIDWTRGYEPLDKEFQQIVRESAMGPVLADKLYKVWRKDGQEAWLLIHIEIQGKVDHRFARRMFNYNTRAFQLYGRTVVSLAVLCDQQKKWRPNEFRQVRAELKIPDRQIARPLRA